MIFIYFIYFEILVFISESEPINLAQLNLSVLLVLSLMNSNLDTNIINHVLYWLSYLYWIYVAYDTC